MTTIDDLGFGPAEIPALVDELRGGGPRGDVLEREPSFDLDGYPPVFVPAAFAWHPARAGSVADEVVDFGASLRSGDGPECHDLDAEQRADLDVLSSVRSDMTYAATEALIVEGRQNGKTDRVILPWTMWDFWVGSAELVDWTSHLSETTAKTRRIVEAMIDANGWLSRRVRQVVAARGSEAIYLTNGREWHWSTRSEGAGRGGPCDVWVADELLYLTASMVGARRPTLRSRENAQMRGASSAGLERSEYLASVVKRGRAGGDPGLAYVERCAPGGFDGSTCQDGAGCSHVFGTSQGCAMDDEGTWHMGNHSLARGRTTYRKIRDERRASTTVALVTEFGRETMGWHEAVAGTGESIDVDVWDRFEDRTSRVAEGRRPDALVVAVRPDQSGSLIAVAGPRADGRRHAALIRNGDLTGDALVAEVVALRRKHHPRRILVVSGPASDDVFDALKRRVRTTERATSGDVAAAVASLRSGIRKDDFRHRGDRTVRASLEAAPPRRTSDGGWTFDTRAGGDVLPVLVVVVARWAAVTEAGKAYDPGRSFG